MCFRFSFRALLLAGRAPWLAFFRLRCGFAMGTSGKYRRRGRRTDLSLYILNLPNATASLAAARSSNASAVWLPKQPQACRSAAIASRTLVRTISTKLAARKPIKPPITAEEKPPSRAPATEAEARLNKPIVPATPPQIPPMQTDTGTSRPRLVRRSKWAGGREGRA